MTEAYFEPEDFDPHAGPHRSGCCSDYALVPLIVLAIAAAVSVAALHNSGFSAARARAAGDNPMPSRLFMVFTPEVQYWGEDITRWSSQAGLDPQLVAVVMQIESCGDPRAVSRAGAMGLFQVMPYHFAAVDEPYLPQTNASRGLDYLRRALAAAEGDARLAFAGYNGGIRIIGGPEWTWPSETVRYVYWGSGIYADATSGSTTSARLAEWLAAGGSSLCNRARQRLQLPG